MGGAFASSFSWNFIAMVRFDESSRSWSVLVFKFKHLLIFPRPCISASCRCDRTYRRFLLAAQFPYPRDDRGPLVSDGRSTALIHAQSKHIFLAQQHVLPHC